MVVAAGSRREWDDVPERVRAVNAIGGFSTGAAAACTRADGRRAFVNAVGIELSSTMSGTSATTGRSFSTSPGSSSALADRLSRRAGRG
jgi:hypothetical protein